jgi:hypothetical protein
MEYLRREIRHELLTLPWYGIFDWLEADIEDEDTLILRGQVVRTATKARGVPGLFSINNELRIEK